MGILFTILGVTNVGKTTQQKLLVERLRNEGYTVAEVKYPKYDIEPTGPRINNYLRKGNPENLSAKDFQELNVQNRKDFEPELLKMLKENDIVIAEMYTGTGIAYGIGDGLSKEWFVKMNDSLKKADLSILLDGTRYLESKEKNHIFENDDKKTEKIREAHLDLAREYLWKIIDANKTISQIHDEIYLELKKHLK